MIITKLLGLRIEGGIARIRIGLEEAMDEDSHERRLEKPSEYRKILKGYQQKF